MQFKKRQNKEGSITTPSLIYQVANKASSILVDAQTASTHHPACLTAVEFCNMTSQLPLEGLRSRPVLLAFLSVLKCNAQLQLDSGTQVFTYVQSQLKFSALSNLCLCRISSFVQQLRKL